MNNAQRQPEQAAIAAPPPPAATPAEARKIGRAHV